MADRYEPAAFEPEWRKRWQEADLFLTPDDPEAPKFYGLDFFPYPSGAGLSVGHCRNYVPTDVICRMKRMQGFNVLHPMGFDAFGLPAENEAIKQRKHPAPMIEAYANRYRQQMELIGISYDWSRSFRSSDPDYYKWTQWIFELLYERGLAYRRVASVNWDPVDKTVLADEEVVGGRAERSGALVEKKWIPQWFFKITAYAQRLIDDLETIDWPEGIKTQQRNWIGRSEGVQFSMRVVFEGPQAGSREQGAGSGEQGAGSREQGAGSREQGARSGEQGAGGEEGGAGGEALTLPSPPGGEGSGELSDTQKLEAELRASGFQPVTDDAVWQKTQQIESKLDRASQAAQSLETGMFDSIKARIEGTQDDFAVHKTKQPLKFEVFTTRIDTVFGTTFCVLAPEHPIVEKILAGVDEKHKDAICAYQLHAKTLSDTDRQVVNREKTGVFTGAWAINPLNQKPVPIWLADYVLATYGTGAIMAVPAHDQRDFDFAMKFGLDIVPVIKPSPEYLKAHNHGASSKEEAGVDQLLEQYLTDIESFPNVFDSKDSTLINSGEYTGMTVADTQKSLGEWMEATGIGERKVQYKLRDWLISRQRYWGCPIPIIYTREGEEQLAPKDSLPVELPVVENYEPSGDGTSPLARIPEFVNTTDRDGRLGRRETDTMGGFACSSWYFLRFADPFNEGLPWDPEKAAYWMPVDCYVGGTEHAVMHLLYARFWTKVLYDAGLVKVKEPFQTLHNQGQVLALSPFRRAADDERMGLVEEGVSISFEQAKKLPPGQVFYRWARMSKSKGNVVTPEEAVEQSGADALRLYLLFRAPFDADIEWENKGMEDLGRFLSRVFRLVDAIRPSYVLEWKDFIDFEELDGSAKKIRRATHRTISNVTADIERFGFNTYVSWLMKFVNELNPIVLPQRGAEAVQPSPSRAEAIALSEAMDALILLLSPGAPHSADELWNDTGHEGFTLNAKWPSFDPKLAADENVTIAVQVNGKLRDTFELPVGASSEEHEGAALACGKVAPHIEGKTVRKVIVVPGKLVNIVVN